MRQTPCRCAGLLSKSLPEISCSGWKSCRYVPVRTSSTTVGSKSTSVHDFVVSMCVASTFVFGMFCWWLLVAFNIARLTPQSQSPPSNHHTAGHVFASTGLAEEGIECVLAGSMIGMPFISSSKMQRHNVLSGQIRIRERIICPLIRAEASEEG